MEHTRTQTLEILRELSVLRAPEGKPFILASGKESDIYVDVRLSILYGYGLMALVECLSELVKGMCEVDNLARFRIFAGSGVGGGSLAVMMSVFFTLNGVSSRALYVRKASEVKAHGTMKRIEGKYLPDNEVIVLEDVITSGGSVLEVVEELRAQGLKVYGVVAVLDREEGGREKLEAAGLQFRTLTTLKELVK